MGSGGDQHLASSALSDDNFGAHMSDPLADLATPTNGDIDYLNNAIHVAEEILAEAPSDYSVTADDCKSLSDLYERRYQQKTDLDDLQAGITWAKQGLTTNHQNIDEMGCFRNLMACLMFRYEQTGELEDLCKAFKPMTKLGLTHENLQPLPGNSYNIQNALSLHQTIKDLLQAYEASLLASLDSISGTVSNLASRDTDDPNYLNHAIQLAEDVLATAPPDHTVPASCFINLDKMLYRR